MSEGKGQNRRGNLNWLVLALVYGVATAMVLMAFAYTIQKVSSDNSSQVLVLQLGCFLAVLALILAVWGPFGAKDLNALGNWYRERRERSRGSKKRRRTSWKRAR